MRRFRSGTLRSGSVDRPVMGASSAGSYEVTPPGRSRASDAAHRADRSTQRQQPTRQAYGESDPTGDATPILTGLRPSVPLFTSPRWRHSGSLWRRRGRPGPEYRSPHPGTWQDAVTSGRRISVLRAFTIAATLTTSYHIGTARRYPVDVNWSASPTHLVSLRAYGNSSNTTGCTAIHRLRAHPEQRGGNTRHL